jgi:ribosomal protein S18 acetylase RimI-like enzyme
VVGGDEVRIRPAIVADGEWLKALHKVAYASLSEQLHDPRAESWQNGFFAGRIAHPIDLFIAEHDGKDVGAVYLENRPDAVFVESLEVLPEHQGRGVGTSTLKWILRHAARLGLHVGLHVHKGNPHAQSLYRRNGFTVIGETATHLRMRSTEEPAE